MTPALGRNGRGGRRRGLGSSCWCSTPCCSCCMPSRSTRLSCGGGAPNHPARCARRQGLPWQWRPPCSPWPPGLPPTAHPLAWSSRINSRRRAPTVTPPLARRIPRAPMPRGGGAGGGASSPRRRLRPALSATNGTVDCPVAVTAMGESEGWGRLQKGYGRCRSCPSCQPSLPVSGIHLLRGRRKGRLGVLLDMYMCVRGVVVMPRRL